MKKPNKLSNRKNPEELKESKKEYQEEPSEEELNSEEMPLAGLSDEEFNDLTDRIMKLQPINTQEHKIIDIKKNKGK